MGLFETIKNFITVPEDEFDDEFVDVEEEEETKKKVQTEAVKRVDTTPRIIGGKSKTVAYNPAQMQVVLVKPDRYDDVTSIADHLNDKKTVVLNLEAADRDLSRRIVDFLSGATYANHGNMRKISKGTFLIVPNGVDMMGELMLEDFEENRMYF
ncbi:MAG: cell division protein SepF [Clostridia bacterium]|nr:cell division protein SepF [Clostridia bacterium]